MNFASLCAQTTEEPIEVYTSATSTAVRCLLLLPPVGNKAPTEIEITLYGKNSERFLKTPKNSQIYIHGAKLKYDTTIRAFSLQGGNIAIVNTSFPIFNTIILSGRCIKDIDKEDERCFKTTAEGLMIANQTLLVSSGRNQADLFNFYAINSADDRFNQAELMVNFTKKGTGLTLQGRLVTDSWIDKETKKRKSNTKIQLISMTLGPKSQTLTTSTDKNNSHNYTGIYDTESIDTKSSTLWGGATAEEVAEPWGQNVGDNLPALPTPFNKPEDFPPF
jgi:single-stranded DNA-binding protein